MGVHARVNGGKAGGASASAKPMSGSNIAKRMHSIGLSTASGVDSNEEVDHSRVCI
jgi:hypothetical protein